MSEPDRRARKGLAGCRLSWPLRLWNVAVIGFIGFNYFALAAHRREIEAATAHRFHYSMVQKPSGVVLAT
jgi:hypothetical protein